MEPNTTIIVANIEALIKYSIVPTWILPIRIDRARFINVLSKTGRKHAIIYNINLDFLLSRSSFNLMPPRWINNPNFIIISILPSVKNNTADPIVTIICNVNKLYCDII